MSDAVLTARAVDKAYVNGPRRLEVLTGLSIEVAAGEAVAVVGDSGVGKSTLLHVLGGLDRPDGGSVRFRDRDVYAGGADSLARFRNRHVGFVFQFHHLLPEFSALENVAMPFRVGRRPVDSARVRRLLDRLGLGERVDHHPGQLSGGEQQRVAIARAVAAAPAVVLADEPTGNLDPGTGERVFQLLRSLQADEGFALILATHSARLARGCDRVLRLTGGALGPLDESAARDYFGVPS